MAIGVTNSSVDPNRMKTAISSLLMSEMAQANGQPNNPSVPFTAPPQLAGGYYPQQSSQQPIIVVQPPAQQIYFGSDYVSGSNRPKSSSQPGMYLFIYDSNFDIYTKILIIFLETKTNRSENFMRNNF